MNTTILYNEDIAKEVETAVMCVFGCKLTDLVGFFDTDYKKIVVFVLSKLYGFDKRNIAQAYSMSYMYVPTVVDEIELRYLLDVKIREKLIEIVKIIGYESRAMDGSRIEFTA
ncbi:MAG: hypothetical protein CMP76_17115 [Flavobacterium sp.]|uniref:hypothetical protein n=1 Tax=Flavobacterium sp. TaxID=239 RepID=UPI000C5D356F|nr:hypothetical protein [Flavobacterium sp.]MBF04999.1 hypothetical protein [Flavobacterium sp.]|tara:strand:+ start:59 stop:397 length:339 start_codon:yes stop_codon:yes gene_type:complete